MPLPANNFSGLFFVNLSQKVFSELKKAIAPFQIFTTDFSSDAAQQGESVKTNIVPLAGAAGSLSATYDSSYIAAAQAGGKSTTPVEIVMNQDPVSGFYITDREAAAIAAGIFSASTMEMIREHVYSIVLHMQNYIFNLLIAANFPAYRTVGAATAFDLDEVIDLEGQMLDLGFPGMDTMRVGLILKTAYFTALKKDKAIQDLSASGIAVAEKGTLYRVNGAPVHAAPGLPPAGGTAATETLVGFAGLSKALGIATRIVQPQVMNDIAHFEVMTDPETGFSAAYRATAHDGKLNHTVDLLYGAKKLVGAAGVRLVETAPAT